MTFFLCAMSVNYISQADRFENGNIYSSFSKQCNLPYHIECIIWHKEINTITIGFCELPVDESWGKGA